jgi:hypothetical protein
MASEIYVIMPFMKRKIFIFVFAFILIILGTAAYFLGYFLPVQFKGVLVKKASEVLHRPITVREISYVPIKGFLIKGLTIYENDPAQPPFASIAKVNFNILFMTFLKSQQIVIPSIIIEKPSIHLQRNDTGQWNFSDLISDKKPQQRQKIPFLLGGIAISDGQVELLDRWNGQPFEDVFTGINFKARLSVTKGIAYEMAAQIPGQAANLKVNGHYLPLTKELGLKASIAKLDLTPYLRYLPIQNDCHIKNISIAQTDFLVGLKGHDLEKLQGHFNIKADLGFRDNNSFVGQFAIQSLNLTKSADRWGFNAAAIILQSTSLNIGNDSFQGNFQGDGISFARAGENISFQGNARVENSIIDFAENHLEGNFTLQQVSGNIRGDTWHAQGALLTENSLFAFGPDTKITGNISAQNIRLRKNAAQGEMQCHLNLANTVIQQKGLFSFQGDVKTIPVAISWQGVKFSYRSPLKVENPIINFSQNKLIAANILTNDLVISVEDKKISAKSQVQTQNLVFNSEKGQTFQGNPTIDFNLMYDPAEQIPFQYSGSAVLSEAVLKGVAQIGEIQAISGKLDFQTDEIRTSKLALTTLNTPLILSGTVNNLSNPYLDITLQSPSLDLQMLNLFSIRFLKDYDLNPAGPADISLQYSGYLSALDQAQINLQAVLQGATLSSSKFPDFLPAKITGIYGVIQYTGDTFSWQDLQANIRNTEYVSSGTLKDFTNPTLQAELSSPLLTLSTRVKANNNDYAISLLQGQYGNSNFDINGNVRAKPNSQPRLDLKGNFEIDFADLRSLNSGLRKYVKQLNLAGKMISQASYQGPIATWEKAIFAVTASSPQLVISGYRLNDVSLNLSQGIKSLGNLDISGNFYNGKLMVLSIFDNKKPNFPFEISAKLEGTNLGLLKQDTKMKKKELEGNLGIDFSIKGDLHNTDSYEGTGLVTIKDGYLWRLNFLEGIGRVLFIPELENTVFTDAQAHFTIRDRRVSTSDIFLAGKFADLLGKGWVGFDKKINFDITPKFKQTEIAQSGSLRKGPSAILAQTDGYINIKISGTLDHPNYGVDTAPSKVIQKATDSLLDGVQGIIEEIMQ